jgi:hypothetical protein
MKALSRIRKALVIAFGGLAGLAACSVTTNDNGGGNNDPAQFSGDFPTGMSCPASCNTCAQSQCGSAAACLHSDCVDFLNCLCVCAPGDSDCQFACGGLKSPDNHCDDCVTTANACLKQKCASDCPDLDPDLSSGTFDAGGSGGPDGGESGAAVGAFAVTGPTCPAACGQCIADHCPSAATCYLGACASFYECACPCDPSDILCLAACSMTSDCNTCAAAVADCVQQNCSTCAGMGTTTGPQPDGGDFCTQLSSCCLLISDTLNSLSCTDTVSAGDTQECEATLLSFEGDGTCP